MKPIREWWPTLRDFFRDVWVEMKKVSWPGRGEVVFSGPAEQMKDGRGLAVHLGPYA